MSTLPMSTLPVAHKKLHWNQPYVTTKSLVIQITDQGQFVASNSVSRTPQTFSPHLFVVLACFLQGTTPRHAINQLQAEEWAIDKSEFEAVVQRMIRLNFLTPVRINGKQENGTVVQATLADSGFASTLSHHVMLRDMQRVLTYRAAIFRHAAGRDVLEIGCGTGILSIFAAQAGARRVVAIEESEIADVAERMFSANGVSDRITLLRGNSRDIMLDAPADLIIHELIGTDPFAENMLVYLDDARRRFLKPGGRLLPGCFEICCVGYEADENTSFLREAREFAGLYGMNFDPFIDALAATDLPRPTRSTATTPLRMLTEECQLYDIDLASDDLSGLPEIEVKLPVQRQGMLGGVEVFFRAHFDETTQLTNTPFLGHTHWQRRRLPFTTPAAVKAGEMPSIVVRLETHLGKQHLAAELV